MNPLVRETETAPRTLTDKPCAVYYGNDISDAMIVGNTNVRFDKAQCIYCVRMVLTLCKTQI